jgi:hypothetical protein
VASVNLLAFLGIKLLLIANKRKEMILEIIAWFGTELTENNICSSKPNETATSPLSSMLRPRSLNGEDIAELDEILSQNLNSNRNGFESNNCKFMQKFLLRVHKILMTLEVSYCVQKYQVFLKD